MFSDGWTWLDDESCSCRKLFSTTLSIALHLPADQLVTVEKARKLGLLLRYGFIWRDDRFVLAKDTTLLETLLKSEYKGVLLDWMMLTERRCYIHVVAKSMVLTYI